jgi:tetratricopeptide (TPR) repeat protein
MKMRSVIVALVVGALSSGAEASRRSVMLNPPIPEAGPGALRSVAIRDLPYGDALFYFYAGDFETALERLQFADFKGRLPHHRDDARLLIGGIELARGDYAEAARTFSEVLDAPNVPDNVRDRAHFYLGKTFYRRGFDSLAVEQLTAAVRGTLPADFDAERRMLLAEALLSGGHDQEAAAVLDHWDAPSVWRSYAEFNLGVAWIRAGKMDQGAQVLDGLGQRSADSQEALALRDQANVALGYAYVQQKRPADALRVLARVRADGPQATKALLGAGWAAADAGQLREALAPWLELRGRDLLDSAVQESYLAVPYGYAQLGADAQAVAAYEDAITEFAAETQRLDESIAAIRAGELAKALEGLPINPGAPVSVDVSRVPAARYLYRLLAQDEFQMALANWRDLATLSRRLDLRENDIAAFAELLAFREHRFNTDLPVHLAALDRHDLNGLVERRTELEARVAEADEHADLAALGTPRQRAIWGELERMEALVDRVGDLEDPEIDDIADRVDLLKGYLYWELSDGFKSRVWTARKRLREVNRLLRESTRSATLIKTARVAVPLQNANLSNRLADLKPRIDSVHARATELRDREMIAVSNLAIRELEAEKDRIREYTLEARYSLATLYDRVSKPVTPKEGASP